MAAKRKNKKPSRSSDPPLGKVPRGGHKADDIPRQYFKWRLDRVDLDGPWAFNQIDINHLLTEVIPKLHEFETMTWAEIDGPTGSHFIRCSELTKLAQDRQNQVASDVDELFSLRLTGPQRIWGVRDVATLRILWWDPQHEVCPSKKKNT